MSVVNQYTCKVEDCTAHRIWLLNACLSTAELSNAMTERSELHYNICSWTQSLMVSSVFPRKLWNRNSKEATTDSSDILLILT